MSSQLTPHVTVPAAAVRNRDDFPVLAAEPPFSTMRRAVIRLRAAHLASGLLREMTAGSQVTAPGRPLFARLDALEERYMALGGDPGDLVR
jgi:hypothetical protein